MALNVTFTGNTYSESNIIECNYQVHYVRQGIWSPILHTEFGQYNFNAGSNTHLTQDGELKPNDVVIICFFTSDSRTTISTEIFSSIAIIHNSLSTYIQDVELKSVAAPSCDLRVLGEYLVNSNITFQSLATLESEWMFSNKKHYQKKSLYSVQVFPNLVFTEDLYDFGTGYSTVNNCTYSIPGMYTINQKSTYSGQELNCSKTIQVKNKAPIVNYIIPEAPVFNETIDIAINIVGNIISAKHYFDNILKKESNNLSEIYSATLNENKTYNYSTEIIWYDGFENQTLIVNNSIVLQNIAPTIDLELIQDNNHIVFKPHAMDVDGFVQNVQFKMFLCKDSVFEEHIDVTDEHNWILLDTFSVLRDIDNPDDFDLGLMFYKGGDYKVQAIAFDDSGLESIVNEEFFNIACNSDNNCGVVDLDWAKRVNNVKFNIKIINTKFNIKKNEIKFKTAINNITFKQNTNNIKFNININKIKFNLKG